MNRHQIFQICAVLLLFAIVTGCTKGLISRGEKKYNSFAYAEALTLFKRAEESKPNDPKLNLKLADTYRMLNKPQEAMKYYKAVDDSIGLPNEVRLDYAKMLMEQSLYEEASNQLEKYLEQNPDDAVAKDLLVSTRRVEELKEDTSLYQLSPIQLQNTVSMFGAVPYGDGLVVAAETEIYSAATTNPWTGYSYLDLFYMEKNPSGNWMAPEPFASDLNSRFHDGPATFSKDGNMVIFTRSDMVNDKKQQITEDNINNFQLFYANKTGEGTWSAPKKIQFNNGGFSVGHPSLSSDGKTLYFSSNMPGGFGGSDIYKSTFDGTSWSSPENLGENINTPGNEVFPSISKDGNRLFFSSEAHQTLGGLDVQESVFSGGQWSKPRNLAYPINSSRDDFSIIVNDDDTTGFISSNRNGVDMVYEWIKVPPVLFIEGLAILKSENLPIEGANIILKNRNDGSETTFTTGPDGKFKLYLAPDTDYQIRGEKDGYFTQTYDVSTGKKSQQEKMDLSFEMDEIVTSDGDGAPNNKTYDIGNIYYDYNDYRIRKDAQPELDRLAKLLRDNPGVNIEIQSHTDCRGSAEFNQNLSNMRAKEVINYLTSRNIDRGRLKSRGFGKSQMIENCECEDCDENQHQRNRRTEFIVLKK